MYLHRTKETIVYVVETRSELEELLRSKDEDDPEKSIILYIFVSADEFPEDTICVYGRRFDILNLVGVPTEQLVRTVIAPRVGFIFVSELTVRVEPQNTP